MRKLLPMVLILTIGSSFILKGQDNDSRTIKSDLVDNRKLEIDKSFIDATFQKLESTAKVGQNLSPILFTDSDVQDYLNIFEFDFMEVKTFTRKQAQETVENLIVDAKNKLEGFKNAKSINLIDSKSFYGDDSYLSRVLSMTIELVDKHDQFIQYELIFMEVNNKFKILSIN